MRLFFAVALPDDIVARVLEVQGAVRSMVGEQGIGWTRPDQFHFTIAFLGEQPLARIQQAVECAHVVRETNSPFEVSLGGLGAFPNGSRPSVVWVGATSGADKMIELAAGFSGLFAEKGRSIEKRELKAHITLGRVKTYKGEELAARALRKISTDEQWKDIGTFAVDRFVLMRSILKPTGSEYTVVDEFELGS